MTPSGFTTLTVILSAVVVAIEVDHSGRSPS
jgi:hypothetical protein